MQRWERPRHRRPVLPTLTTKPPSCHQPSFSSTLLDAIYRSMDDDGPPGAPTREQPRRVTVDTAATMRNSTTTAEKLVTRPHAGRSSANSASTTSVSTVGRFSSSSASSSFSSEFDSAGLPTPAPPRPIRASEPSGRTPKESNPEGRRKASEGSGQSRKTKPPLSPGARLASFLTNLFTASGNPKKVKANTSASGRTPPSGGSASKSSVGYYSDGVVVREKTPSLAAVGVGEVPRSAAAEKRAVEAARELVRRYTEIKMGVDEEEEEDEEDGRGSCSSSELFELENLAGIGELPVYGTTRLETNPAVARGLVL